MDLLIRNIKQLLQADDRSPRWICGPDMKNLPVLTEAYVLISNGAIASWGPMGTCPERAEKVIDASGRIVMPTFCDPHTHLVFAATREQEFVDRLNGLTYEEIARRGGGILNSAKKLRNTPEDELFELALPRVSEIIAQGTGAVEIKSGYGLDTASEIKMLRVIRRLKEASPIEIKSTFLGAHAVPPEFRDNPDGYVDLIIKTMIPRIASEGLADYIDVFCDKGFFTPEQTERILDAGSRRGLIPKIHANELDYSGGIQAGVKYGALSVDHLEYTGDEEIKVLKNSKTMPTLLPGAAFFLGLPWPPARKMIDSGLPVAIGSDYNPGSCPTGNMMLMMAIASIRMNMLPEEVITAATINSAYAMGLSDSLGSVTTGKTGSLIITRPVPGYGYLPYAFGADHIENVIIKGKSVINK
jgi:imidazolonepropionase